MFLQQHLNYQIGSKSKVHLIKKKFSKLWKTWHFVSLKISDFFYSIKSIWTSFILKSDSRISKYCSNNLFLQPKLLFTTTIYATVFTFSCDFWSYNFFFIESQDWMQCSQPFNISCSNHTFLMGFKGHFRVNKLLSDLKLTLYNIHKLLLDTVELVSLYEVVSYANRWNLISDSRM